MKMLDKGKLTGNVGVLITPHEQAIGLSVMPPIDVEDVDIEAKFSDDHWLRALLESGETRDDEIRAQMKLPLAGRAACSSSQKRPWPSSLQPSTSTGVGAMRREPRMCAPCSPPSMADGATTSFVALSFDIALSQAFLGTNEIRNSQLTQLTVPIDPTPALVGEPVATTIESGRVVGNGDLTSRLTMLSAGVTWTFGKPTPRTHTPSD